MFDFVPLIDALGEPLTIALMAFALAFAFGALAQRTGFCTRAAVLEVMSGRPGTALSVWLAALGGAILLGQAAVHGDVFSPEDSRFFSGPVSLSGPIIGGVLFGIGMSLARGCTSRLLVLGSAGNLRAIVAIFFTSIAAYATLSSVLVPLRDFVAGLLNNSSLAGNAVTDFVGGGTVSGMATGFTFIVAAVFIANRKSVGVSKLVGGLAMGALIAGGWIATYTLTSQFFDPIAVESLSFVRPASTFSQAGFSDLQSTFVSLDGGLIAGIIVGAFLASVLFRSFKVRTFSEEGAPHFLRYVIGGLLMGFGGILASGCTVGAGFTGGSVLAVSAILALVSMIGAGILTELVLDRKARQYRNSLIIPAE